MDPHDPGTAAAHVGILEAAGVVGWVQVAIALVVVAYAVALAWRPPVRDQGTKLLVGVVAACVPFVLGHFAMLVAQASEFREMSRAGAAATQRELVYGMEAASVQTWVGWTASGVAITAVLLARLRFPRDAPGA